MGHESDPDSGGAGTGEYPEPPWRGPKLRPIQKRDPQFPRLWQRRDRCNVAGGKVDASARDEIIVGSGFDPNLTPFIRGFNDDGTGIPTINFIPLPTPPQGMFGANVALVDVDNDDTAEIFYARGPDSAFGPEVRGFQVDPGSLAVQAMTGISFFAYPSTLWPPNHDMVPIFVDMAISDDCIIANYRLLGVVSDEPETGCGSGNQSPDIQGVEAGQPDVEFEVRAERCGTGDGRTYTATYEVDDKSGNSTIVSATITVPHDKR